MSETKQLLENDLRIAIMSIRKLNHFFIYRFSFWLKTVRKCNHNTTMKYLGHFRKNPFHCGSTKA
jgi:hypothetical protein